MKSNRGIAGLVRTACCTAAALALVSCSRPEEGISASGTIETTEVRISSRSWGEVLSLGADEGDQVAKGDVLGEIDHAALDIQLAQARAGVDYAAAQMRLLLKGARQEDIVQAAEALAQTAETRKQAEMDYERTQNLFASASATAKQRDDAEARYAVAKAQYAQAEQALKKLSNLARPEEVESAQAKLSQARYTAQLLEKQIADCTVRAPLDATVLRRLVEVGELAGQGTGLYVLSDLSLVHLTIYVPETDLGRIAVGQPAEVRIDGNDGRIFPGRVSYLAREAEFTPKNVQTKDERVKLVFAVRIDVPNSEGILKAGMPADAGIREP